MPVIPTPSATAPSPAAATSSTAAPESLRVVDLTIVIPAADEGPNLTVLMPQIRAVVDDLRVDYEILVVLPTRDTDFAATDGGPRVRVLRQESRGYGGALLCGFSEARGRYVLTMDADLSHPPTFIRTLWEARVSAEVVIASRYVEGGSAEMPRTRRVLSRILNTFFSRGLSLRLHDMSSGFRLYKVTVLRNQRYAAPDFDILQRIVVQAYAEGWRIREVPFDYAARRHGTSHARVVRFGLAYLRTFWELWKLRNSILAADYDDRAHDSPIWLQRYWQRNRHKHVTELIAGEGPVLDVGCGSSRIISALPSGSVAMDILLRKLRYARKFGRPVVHASGFQLPVRDESFSCVLCSQVIEHVPKESPILDELCRALKPGGRLVLGTPDYANWQWVWMEKAYGLAAPGGYADEHISHYTQDELRDIFAKRGFVVEDVRYILQGELIMAFRKKYSVAA
jgi:glycosyltransferase involved in cell wall biosynthesis